MANQESPVNGVLASALAAIGEPVIRKRTGGLKGLTRIIVQQQLSVASAQAILKRCTEAFDMACADTILAQSDDTLKACGLSRPKARYLRCAAEAVREGNLNFRQLKRMSDSDALDVLLAIKGVGPWTAAIYLLFCEGRLSIWPPKDVALLAAYTHAAGLTERPAMSDFDAMAADAFQPEPGRAAHILWTYYGHIKNRKPV